jgi:hypothetical protein
MRIADIADEFREWYEKKYDCTIEQRFNSLVPEEAEFEDLVEAFMMGFKLGKEEMKRKILSAEWRGDN